MCVHIQTGWRPVTEWEVLCNQDIVTNGSEKDHKKFKDLRKLMTQSVCHLAKSNRQILYLIRPELSLGAGQIELHLSVISGAPRNTSMKSILEYYAAEESVSYAHSSLREHGNVEAALKLLLKPLRNEVEVLCLNRDISLKSSPIDQSYPNSKVAKVLTCFALAMAGEIFMTMSLDIRQTGLYVQAADAGSGRLINFYEQEFGLEVQPKLPYEYDDDPVHMRGRLYVALAKCNAVWNSSCQEVTECKKKSHLSTFIEHAKQRLDKETCAPSSLQRTERRSIGAEEF